MTIPPLPPLPPIAPLPPLPPWISARAMRDQLLRQQRPSDLSFHWESAQELRSNWAAYASRRDSCEWTMRAQRPRVDIEPSLAAYNRDIFHFAPFPVCDPMCRAWPGGDPDVRSTREGARLDASPPCQLASHAPVASHLVCPLLLQCARFRRKWRMLPTAAPNGASSELGQSSRTAATTSSSRATLTSLIWRR